MFTRPGFQSPVFSGPSCVRVILDDEGVGVEVFTFGVSVGVNFMREIKVRLGVGLKCVRELV